MTTIRTADVPFMVGKAAPARAKNPYPIGSNDAARWDAGAALRTVDPEAVVIAAPKEKRTWMTWTDDENTELTRRAGDGESLVDIGRAMGRTKNSIEAQAKRLHVAIKAARIPHHLARSATPAVGDGQTQAGGQ